MATGWRNPGTGAGPDELHSGRSTSGRANAYYTQINNHVNVSTPLVKLNEIATDEVVMNNPIVIMTKPFYMAPRQPPDPNDEALHDPPPPEDLSYLFKPEDLERDVEDKFLVPVAKAFIDPKECRWLARKLKIDAPTMSDLNMRYSGSLDELVYQVMMTWKRINPQVKVGDLVTALCNSRNQRQARVLKDFLERNHP